MWAASSSGPAPDLSPSYSPSPKRSPRPTPNPNPNPIPIPNPRSDPHTRLGGSAAEAIASLDYTAERRLIRANELHVQGCSPRWGHYAEALLGGGAKEGPSPEGPSLEGSASECASSLVYDAHGLWRQAYATDLLMTCLVVVLMVGHDDDLIPTPTLTLTLAPTLTPNLTLTLSPTLIRWVA